MSQKPKRTHQHTSSKYLTAEDKNIPMYIHSKYSIDVNQLDNLAHEYVHSKDELINPPQVSSISQNVELCLSCLLGYNQPHLPATISNFLLCINCVYPFQMINKLEGLELHLHIVLHNQI